MASPSKSKRSPRISVEVSADVIEGAQRRDSSHCMIADAIKVAVPDARFISVDLATIRFTDLLAGRRYIYLTPRVAQEALLRFDQGEASEPFRFRIQGAHVLLTGSARKARTPDHVPDRVRLEPMNSVGNGINPERRGGASPPAGPLSNAGTGRRTGRIRRFGIRGLIR